MKKQKPLEKDIAERIAQEAFNQEYEPHEFSSEYEKKKNAFLTNIHQKKAFTWTTKRIIMVAVALILLVPVSGFTVNKVYQWYASQDNYKTVISINNQASYDDKFYQLDFGYLPSNMSEMENIENKYSYDGGSDIGGLTFSLWKIPGQAEFTEYNTTKYTEKTFGDNKAYLIDRQKSYFGQGKGFSRIVYLSFEKEGYVLEAYVGDDVPQEDLEKILANASLKETTKEQATFSIDYHKDSQINKNHVPIDEYKGVQLPINSSNLLEIGESATVKPWDTSRDEEVNFVVNSVDVLDTLENLEATNFNKNSFERQKEDHILSDDLTLQPYTQQTIKLGDGETTLDEVVSEQLVTPKFVYVTATVQNASDSELDDLSFQNSPILLEEQEDGLVHVDNSIELPNMTARTGEVDYLDNHGEGEKNFYKMSTFKANEKRTIHFGFFVDDNQLNKLILPVFNYSDPNDLSNDNYYWVDLRQ